MWFTQTDIFRRWKYEHGMLFAVQLWLNAGEVIDSLFETLIHTNEILPKGMVHVQHRLSRERKGRVQIVYPIAVGMLSEEENYR